MTRRPRGMYFSSATNPYQGQESTAEADFKVARSSKTILGPGGVQILQPHGEDVRHELKDLSKPNLIGNGGTTFTASSSHVVDSTAARMPTGLFRTLITHGGVQPEQFSTSPRLRSTKLRKPSVSGLTTGIQFADYFNKRLVESKRLTSSTTARTADVKKHNTETYSGFDQNKYSTTKWQASRDGDSNIMALEYRQSSRKTTDYIPKNSSSTTRTPLNETQVGVPESSPHQQIHRPPRLSELLRDRELNVSEKFIQWQSKMDLSHKPGHLNGSTGRKERSAEMTQPGEVAQSPAAVCEDGSNTTKAFTPPTASELMRQYQMKVSERDMLAYDDEVVRQVHANPMAEIRRKQREEEMYALENDHAKAMTNTPSSSPPDVEGLGPFYEAKSTVHLRPATRADVTQMLAIYSDWGSQSCAVPEAGAFPDFDVVTVESGLPWVVAYDTTVANDDRNITGFGYVEEFGCSDGAFCFSSVLTVFVHPKYLQRQIGTWLVDALVGSLDRQHKRLESYVFDGDFDRFQKSRKVVQIIVEFPFPSNNPGFAQMIGKWLGKFGFASAGLLKDIARVHGSWVSQATFQLQTSHKSLIG